MITLQQLIEKKQFSYVNPYINETNFPKPNKIQKEGWKIIKMDKPFTSKKALERIKEEGYRPANAWELALIAVNHPEEISRGMGLIAFGQTFRDSDGHHRVPIVRRHSGGGWGFDLAYFEGVWRGDDCLVCFCDQPSDTQALETPSDNLTPLGEAIEVVKKAGYKVIKEL